MYVITGSRKGDFGNPGPVTPDAMVQTDAINTHINKDTVRICLTKTKDVFESIVDLTMTPQEALDLADKLTKGANKLTTGI